MSQNCILSMDAFSSNVHACMCRYGARIRARSKSFVFPPPSPLRQNVLTVSGAHPAFTMGGHRGLCPRRPGNETHRSLPCDSEAKNDWIYASSLPVRLGGVDRGFTLFHLSLHVCASLLFFFKKNQGLLNASWIWRKPNDMIL